MAEWHQPGPQQGGSVDWYSEGGSAQSYASAPAAQAYGGYGGGGGHGSGGAAYGSFEDEPPLLEGGCAPALAPCPPAPPGHVAVRVHSPMAAPDRAHVAAA